MRISKSKEIKTSACGEGFAERGQDGAKDAGQSRQVQGMAHVFCKEIGLMEIQFYDDDLRDENTVLALRLLVKDLLVLFQAGNEGVCNILGMFLQHSQAHS